MARPKKSDPPPAPTEAPPAPEDDPRSALDLLITYHWHRGEEAMAVEAYRASFPEPNTPSIADAMVRCAKVADVGPVPPDYRPPGADPVATPLEQVVHPPDPAFAPTEPRETVTAEVPVARRYEVRGTQDLQHTFTLTPEEALAMAVRAEKQRQAIVAMKATHAAIRKQQKEDEAAATAEHARLSTCAAEGKESREIRVQRIADYVTGTVALTMPDGSVLRTEPLADDDRQLSMFRVASRSGAVVDTILSGLENAPPLPEDAEPEDDGEAPDDDSEDLGDF